MAAATGGGVAWSSELRFRCVPITINSYYYCMYDLCGACAGSEVRAKRVAIMSGNGHLSLAQHSQGCFFPEGEVYWSGKSH